ncbi:hypothetical protein ZEAMMB73_Zm00001d012323 [Zea mays]|uniref:Histone deacetylase HDT1 n=1 Tax=Zea mays TaxID=4577 RepID=A0A1D6G866_MAIZE|nr:hypothetical protein ZEAMMB73_Zm00001d012323 [Zea mays]
MWKTIGKRSTWGTADGDRLEQRLGEDKVKILEQAFMEAADNALPHPMEDAYLEACHTNNMEWKMCIYGADCSEISLVQVRGSGMLKDSACHELDKIRSLKRPYIKRVQDRHKETINCLKRNTIEMEGYIRPLDVVIIVLQYIPCSDDQHSDGVADDHPSDSLFSPTYHHHKEVYVAVSIGLDVKPGSTVKCEPGYGFMLHLSQNPHIQFDLVFDKEFELSHTSKTTIVFFTGYKVEQPFKEDGYPFLFSIELVLFQVEVIRTFFVSLTSCLPSSTMDLDSEDEDEELNVPVVKENDIFNNDLGGPYAFLEASPHGANHTGKADGKKQKSQEKAVPAASKSSPASKKSKDDDDSDEDETDDSNEDETDDSDEGEGLSPEEGDDDDSSDEDDTSDDEEEDTSTPKKHEAGKKRAAESFVLKTPLSDKKAKVATPSAQKTGVPLNGLTKLSSKIV